MNIVISWTALVLKNRLRRPAHVLLHNDDDLLGLSGGSWLSDISDTIDDLRSKPNSAHKLYSDVSPVSLDSLTSAAELGLCFTSTLAVATFLLADVGGGVDVDPEPNPS